ncbi:MAG: NAD(P)H-dependent oxidoreductase [Bacteroidetes bacterium]|nr:NAD(P)H-dependent oxidoreductase [Bacteroidota bacterium]
MIGILSGSSRKNSNTARVAKAIQRIAASKGLPVSECIIPDFTQYDIPFANGGHLHKEQLSAFQQSVYDCMKNSHLIFVLSPEYNWFPSAEIINLIHQMGNRDFKECWDGKIFATCGISTGRGGRIPAVQLSYVLNKLINVLDLHSVVSGKIFESQFTNRMLDENGNSAGHEEYDHGLEQYVKYNLELSQKILPALNG